jgi:hypothetical protein
MSFRILSLDGGGSWALIEARALMAVYGDLRGRELLREFDLVAATSGGSIVLGCLLEDFTLSGIVALFNSEDRRRAIFSKTRSLPDRALHRLAGIGPQYSADKKLPALRSVLKTTGDLTLAQAVAGIRRPAAARDLHVLVTAFDYDRNRAAFFRSAPAGGPEWGQGDASAVTLAEAIHASTNAPVNYFDRPATFPDRRGRYWDGAISGCNNPIVAAVTEAIVLRQDPLNISALSLGTGTVALLPPGAPGVPAEFQQAIVNPGLTRDLKKLATAILDDPPDIASFLAHVMTGGGIGLPPALRPVAVVSRIVRMSPMISPVSETTGGSRTWAPPGNLTPADFQFLAQLGMDAVEQRQVDAISSYTALWLADIAPNQPVRMDGGSLACEIGQDRFSAANAAWAAIA